MSIMSVTVTVGAEAVVLEHRPTSLTFLVVKMLLHGRSMDVVILISMGVTMGVLTFSMM